MEARVRPLWIRYLLHFVGIAALALVVCLLGQHNPSSQWALLLLVGVMAAWMSSSVVANNILALSLAGRGSAMAPLLQVFWTVVWSVGNFIVLGGIVVVCALVTGMAKFSP
jgi:hypothetical protein